MATLTALKFDTPEGADARQPAQAQHVGQVDGVALIILDSPLPPVEALWVGAMDVGAVGLEQIGYPVPAVGGLDDHLGIWARLRHRPRHRHRIVRHPSGRELLARRAYADDHRPSDDESRYRRTVDP